MRALIKKNTLTNELLEVQQLVENENIICEIVDAPTSEERPDEIGHYELNTQGELVVVYEPRPKTVEEQLEEQARINAELMLEIAILKGGTK